MIKTLNNLDLCTAGISISAVPGSRSLHCRDLDLCTAHDGISALPESSFCRDFAPEFQLFLVKISDQLIIYNYVNCMVCQIYRNFIDLSGSIRTAVSKTL